MSQLKNAIKRILFLLVLALTTVSPLMAQKVLHYHGKLTVRPESPFVQNDVTVDVSADRSTGSATITLHRVRFSRMMPVRLTIQIPHVAMSSVSGGSQLYGHDIVPLKNGSPYAQRMVKHLYGSIKDGRLRLSLIIGTAPIRFEGVLGKAD